MRYLKKTIYDSLYVKAGDVISLSYAEDLTYYRNFLPGYAREGYNILFKDFNGSCFGDGYLDLTLGLSPSDSNQPFEMESTISSDTTKTSRDFSIKNVIKFPNGKNHTFPENQMFDAEIIEGHEYGKLTSVFNAKGADKLEDAQEPLSFVLDDSLNISDVSVKISISAKLGDTDDIIIGIAENKFSDKAFSDMNSATRKKVVNSMLPSGEKSQYEDIVLRDTLVLSPRCERPDRIMLGETKYFYVTDDGSKQKSLTVCELKDNGLKPGAIPKEALDKPFGEDPIEVTSGGKSGIYWEQKWPEIDSNGSVTMHPLSDKLIRVVGRYWEADKNYKVVLKASKGDRTGKLELKVVKPAKLGENNNHRIYTDAFGNKHDLDSLSIVYGGRTGMPPHFLKGMISQESSRLASYRYEPDNDYKYNVWRTDNDSVVSASMQQNQYWITDQTDEGTPLIPINHTIYDDLQNVIPYPGFDGTMYDLFRPNREEEISSSGEITEKLTKLRGEAYELMKNENILQDSIGIKSEQIAQQNLSDWLKNTWRGGLSNIAKQTRIVASYGPMQLIYLFGYYDGNYPVNEEYLPETLNENVDVAMEYSLQFYIQNKFDLNAFSTNEVDFAVNKQWPNGFEESLKRAANAYNGRSGDAAATWHYGEEVWQWALSYLPMEQ